MLECDKYESLIKYMKKFQNAAIAFSGGVDSTFLLRAFKEALGDKVIAFTVITPYMPNWETAEAKKIASDMNIRLETIEAPIIDSITNNPVNRCYICKKFLFEKIKEKANKLGFNFIFDGTNIDDTKDYRPGLKALEELNIISPLKENSITKNEVRFFAKELGISNWNKPACACILSRIPYNTAITIDEIRKVEKSEEYLMKLGFYGARVRSHGNIARIELQNGDMEKLIDSKVCKNVSKKLKEFGYDYVTVDLEGYKTGSLNQNI